MLLSPSHVPSRRGRSRSLDSHLDEVISLGISPSAPHLIEVSSNLRRSGSGGFARLHVLQPPALSELSSNLIDVKEGSALKDGLHTLETKPEGCWELQDTWEWYNSLPWLAGMNYLPRTAVNFVEMWDESSFDPKTINEELEWAAEKLGYNTLRTNIPMVLYEHDAEGLTRRINKFLRIAARNGFVVMLCPLDDCEFSGKPAKPGPQPDPVPGLHNSQAVGSPGRDIVRDPSQWFRVEEYIRYVVRNWGQDKRIFLLDLYNEPGNPWIFRRNGTEVIPEVKDFEEKAFQLMEKVFQWAREERPSQPLTVSAWHMPDPFFDSGIVPLTHPIDKRAMELSDIISVHAYCDPACLQATLKEITVLGKPILLTEWMARQVKSTYDSALPTLKELKVGAYQWGLVKGKTQTHLPWPHVAHKYEGDPMWWHDVLEVDGTFHNEQEGEIIRSLAYPQSKALSGDMFLLDVDSLESMESFQHQLQQHEPPASRPPPQVFEQHLSQNALSALPSHHQISEHHLSMAETPVIQEGEQAVIPSVCSISMATINAMAAAQAAEQEHYLDQDTMDDFHHTKSVPTFGTHMSTPNVEGLDLAEFVGIEF